MRKVDLVVVHCLATPEGRDVHINEVRRWHVEERGWSDVGYHWLVTLDGSIEKGRDESISGAHAKGYNSKSIGVAYVGGVDVDMEPKDTRTDAQKMALHCLIEDIRGRYPKAEVIGHRDVSSKDCPSFDAKEEFKQ